MDYTDLGPAMTESAERSKLEKLEARVAKLEDVLTEVMQRLHSEPATHIRYDDLSVGPTE